MSFQHQFQLSLREPVRHFTVLHEPDQYGTVVVCLLDGPARPKIERIYLRRGDPAIPQIVRALEGVTDVAMTVNQFRGSNRSDNLVSLRALFVDLDRPGITEDELFAFIKRKKLPTPSLVVWSGRGVHLYWLIKPAPQKALPQWATAQRALAKTFAAFGADAKDVSRPLRVVGTKNPKTNTLAAGYLLHPRRRSLHELTDAIAGPRPKASVVSLDGERSRRGKGPRRGLQGSIYGWWYRVKVDLAIIADHYWFGGIPEGHRDEFLFLMAVASSWFVPFPALGDEIAKLAETFTPDLSERQVRQYMSTLMKKAEAAAAGEKIMWGGKERDPRYWYKRETLVELLGDLITPELIPRLRALVPGSVIRERKTKREQDRRHAAGADTNTGKGYRTGNATKRSEALLLRSMGMTIRGISEYMGCSYKSVWRWLRAA